MALGIVESAMIHGDKQAAIVKTEITMVVRDRNVLQDPPQSVCFHQRRRERPIDSIRFIRADTLQMMLVVALTHDILKHRLHGRMTRRSGAQQE